MLENRHGKKRDEVIENRHVATRRVRVKGSLTQVPHKTTRAGIRVAQADGDSCRFVAPCAKTGETSGRTGEFVRERRALRVVVVEQSEEVGGPSRPLGLHLHPTGRLGEDERKRASPDYENADGRVNVQRDPSCEGGDRFVVGQSPSVRTYSG